jgi:hypothetical protein
LNAQLTIQIEEAFMKTSLKALAAAALFLWVSEAGQAGPVGTLTTFTAGTTAKASEVNGNFSAVSTAVNANDGRITALETTVTGGNVSPTGNIVLVPSTATAGNILKGTTPFLHNFGLSNTFIGENAGNFTMTGLGTNTAIGVSALASNATGNNNTASGAFALQSNTTGDQNTASGAGALQANTTGTFNTASGSGALVSNQTGSFNTASGAGALAFNTIGDFNTAGGLSALSLNTTGSNNTASGAQALAGNTIGIDNTADGAQALQANTTGTRNTANGRSALSSNTTGGSNTASGRNALLNNTTGTGNTANGANALNDNIVGTNDTACGAGALFHTTGSGNIGLGTSAGFFLTTGSNNIDIGHTGVAAEANTIRIGQPGTQTAAFFAGVRGVTTVNADAVAVVVDSAGQLGTVSSSRSVKDDIADMDKASGVLMRLRPVTFHYKSDKNPAGRTLQYGLVAEEVAEVAPGLVAHSADGRIETVYYQFLAPMLLNEYQKQQRTIEAQAAELTRQKLEIAELHRQTARIARLERQNARIAGLLGQLERTGTIASAGR